MDTISTANSGVTSSSTTSEGCCAAIQAACQVLVERLTPVYQMLKAAAPDSEIQWETLISKVTKKGLLTLLQVSRNVIHIFMNFRIGQMHSPLFSRILNILWCCAGNIYDRPEGSS